MFDIEIEPEGHADLQWFRKYERVRIGEEIRKQLRFQPAVETRNRKRLRPSHLSEWELRIGNVRVFYDVDVQRTLVKIMAIGYKDGNRLYFRGEEFAHEETNDK